MYSNFSELKADLLANNTTCFKVVNDYIALIEEKKHLNAFLEVFEKTAVQKAKEVDAKIKKGNAGRLAGLIVGIKDNICYDAHEVSSSSQILKGFKSIYSSTVVEKLLA